MAEYVESSETGRQITQNALCWGPRRNTSVVTTAEKLSIATKLPSDMASFNVRDASREGLSLR
ncbi:hypothetical protein M2171_002420 [Bradyrhizobium japonicum USDA 38]|nr:hypothetical protein [Bradyrhizobium japonicum USDA 38]MCS3945801.1 hypothetical protein [Bradyrhizobium japonicum]